MTDLVAGLLPEYPGTKEFLSLTLTSGQKVWTGGLAAVATTGKLVNGTGGSTTVKVIGTFVHDYDATGGEITALVKLYRPFQGVYLTNYVTDPVVTADIGKQVYVFDNHQVCHTAGSNAVAGIAWGFNSKGAVLVEMLAQTATQAVLTSALDTSALFDDSDNWAPTAGSLVSGTTFVIGSAATLDDNGTVTLPTSGVPAGTVVKFAANGTQGAYTITYQQGSTTLTTALTASVRHLVIAENVGDATTAIWVVNAYVNAH
jgi:hypothetical protein